jgi:seryl-tRNA synthetase
MTSTRKELADALIENGFWIPTGVPGVVGRSARFEALVEGFDAIVVGIGRDAGAERIEFPPVVDREVIRHTHYMESFPELCGSVHSYRKDRGAHMDLVDCVDEGEDWGPYLEQMPLTLCPAACYPLYPACAGVLPEGGRHFDLSSYVFRAEPSDDPARLQSFRLRENVRMADPDTIAVWRGSWCEQAVGLLSELGIPVTLEVASDPFFGRGGRMLSANQIAEELKFEILVPITSVEKPTAICSVNYHEDKFSQIYEIRMPDGVLAHTACIGFGLERVILALIETHGVDVDSWPGSIREALSL